MGNFFKTFGNALISGGASLLGSAFGAIGSAQATKANNRANLELAKYQYSQNLEQWHRQNEYNSPSAQMQRFKEAGLNPNLIYGQGSNGNATSSPQFESPRFDSVAPSYNSIGAGIGSAIGLYNNLHLQQKQIEEADARISNYHANTELAKNKTLTETWNKFISEYKASGLKASLPYLSDFYRLRNDNAQQQVNNNVIRATLLSQQASYMDEMIRQAKIRGDVQEELALKMAKADLIAKQVQTRLNLVQIDLNKQLYKFHDDSDSFRTNILHGESDRANWDMSFRLVNNGFDMPSWSDYNGSWGDRHGIPFINAGTRIYDVKSRKRK